MRLSYLYLALLFLSLASPTQATVLSEPGCSVAAEILDVDQSQNSSPIVKFRITSYEPIGPSGNCDFIALDQVITTSGGSSPNILQKGQQMETLAGYNLGMGPEGVVPFIQWKPITINGTIVPKELDFFMQSGAEHPVSTEKDERLKKYLLLLRALRDGSIASYPDKGSVVNNFGTPNSKKSYMGDGQYLLQWTYDNPIDIGTVFLYFNDQDKLMRWDTSSQSSDSFSTDSNGI